ncbi:MAG: ABC transporter permease subunit, partial [Coriobacteriia bacterium]|nr:ABC transporter permease subunit [Coriobacteriia bacterium]
WLLFSWTWLPLFLVSALVADSFAGERERHTLETLLTTALSDRAILFGKIAAAVSYGYGMLLSVMLMSLLTVNAVWGVREGRLLLFSAPVTLGVLVIGLLVTLLIAAIGVMISLRAKTVRQAGQALSLGILAILWIPGLIIVLSARTLSDVQQQALWEWATTLDGRVVAAVCALVLLALDAVFVGIAMRRFKRSRLSLD